MSIEANIAGRKAAEQVFDLIAQEVTSLMAKHGPESRKAFFDTLRNAFREDLTYVVQPEGPKPMGDKEAFAFGFTAMPFGQYKGTPISDVPLDYLDWLVSQQDEFKEKINRYLMNASVAATDRGGVDEAF